MLQTIRERATGWIAYTIVILLVIPFALWGINSYFGESPAVDVAEVGDISVTLQEFQQAYQQRMRNLQELLGDGFDISMVNEGSLKNEVLQQLINDKVLTQTALREGLWVGDQQLNQAIRSFEAFQRDGEFNVEQYERILYIQGYTPTAFEQNFRNSLLGDQLRRALAASSMLTGVEIDSYVSLFAQKRELSYVVLTKAGYFDRVAIDDAEVESYFEENKDRFLSPEQIKVEYLELKLEQIADSIEVNDTDLRTTYEEQIANYSEPEERSASHVLVTVSLDDDPADQQNARKRAQEILEAIKAGEKTFEQVMAEAQSPDVEGMEAGELGIITKGMFDSAFDDTLYAIQQEGDISEPVQTPFGFHLIRLDQIKAAKVKDFADVREEISREVRLRRAESEFYDAAETLSNLSFEHPDSLVPPSEALGLDVAESDWFGRDGGQGMAHYPKAVEAAFSNDVLRNGYNSEAIEVEPGHVVVMRLYEHKEAAPLGLEEARADIVEQLRGRKANELLQADVKKLHGRAEQGESLAALAEEFGGELQSPGLVGRNDVNVDNAVLGTAFTLPKPAEDSVSADIAALGNGDQAIIVLNRVEAGATDELSETERTALVQRLEGQLGTAEFEAFLASRRARTEVVTYNDRL